MIDPLDEPSYSIWTCYRDCPDYDTDELENTTNSVKLNHYGYGSSVLWVIPNRLVLV